MGIRQDYSPVADVNVNPANPVIGVRSFGADPEAVAELVAAEVTGYQRSGVAACAKHFPGHGDTATDSHTGFPVITHSREQWEELDAPPFRAAIEAGIDAIMTAHLMVPALDDSGDPATLSRPSSPASCARNWATTGWWSPTPSACRAYGPSTATNGCRCWR